MTGDLWRSPVLMVIDVQRAIDDPKWKLHGGRNNPDAELKIQRLLEAWRSRQLPIIHVRHNSLETNSPYRPGQLGHEFKPEATPQPGETVITKQTNSAFIGTDLEPKLRAAGYTILVICGVITNNSVEATVRMAGNLGFETYIVEDACCTFAKLDRQRRLWSAEEVHALSLANLNGEYCTVVTTAETLRRLEE